MILKARVVVPMDGPPIEHGAVVVDDNAIVAVGKAEEEVRWMDEGEVVELGDVALLPGLINAHCHLDYSTLRYSLSPSKSFASWVKRTKAGRFTISCIRSGAPWKIAAGKRRSAGSGIPGP